MSTATLAMPTRRRVPPPSASSAPAISNARLAAVALIAAESMLFAGLVGMYLVFRLATDAWPPADLPRLPIPLTAANTALLLLSVVPLHRALRAARRDDFTAVTRLVAVTGLLGVVFLAVQGYEWWRLVQHGLTLQAGRYGSSFYVLIGCHAVHVLAAVVWITIVTVLAERRRFTVERHDGLEMVTMFWYFVCALWAFLFPLVYLY